MGGNGRRIRELKVMLKSRKSMKYGLKNKKEAAGKLRPIRENLDEHCPCTYLDLNLVSLETHACPFRGGFT